VQKPIVCGICGFVLDKVSDCPRCKLMNEEAARQIEARQKERVALLEEVDNILKEQGDETPD
jgi:phage FluMu protein Com